MVQGMVRFKRVNPVFQLYIEVVSLALQPFIESEPDFVDFELEVYFLRKFDVEYESSETLFFFPSLHKRIVEMRWPSDHVIYA